MIEGFFNETFTRVRYVKNNVGKVETTLIGEFRGRYEDHKRMVPSSNGEQSLSKARIFTKFDSDIQEGDRIVKGVLDLTGVTGQVTGNFVIPKDVQTFPVLMSSPMKGFGPSHKEILVG